MTQRKKMTPSTWLAIAWQVWLMIALSGVLIRSFGSAPPDIPPGTAAALATVFGLPVVVYELFKWARGRADARQDRD